MSVVFLTSLRLFIAVIAVDRDIWGVRWLIFGLIWRLRNIGFKLWHWFRYMRLYLWVTSLDLIHRNNLNNMMIALNFYRLGLLWHDVVNHVTDDLLWDGVAVFWLLEFQHLSLLSWRIRIHRHRLSHQIRGLEGLHRIQSAIFSRNEAHPQELYEGWSVSLAKFTKTCLNLIVVYLVEIEIIALTWALQGCCLEKYHSSSKCIWLICIMLNSFFPILKTVDLFWWKIGTVSFSGNHFHISRHVTENT